MSAPKLKILVLCDFEPGNANVIRDYLYAFNLHSRHECYYLHTWKSHQCSRLQKLSLNQFDVILMFWDYYWTVVDDELSPAYLPAWVYDQITAASALKVMFLQDEYRAVRKINRTMARLGVNIIFTCVDEKDHDIFYPKRLIPSLQAAHTVLPGYVPANLKSINFPVTAHRPVDIGYRSRNVPFWLGDLGQEKVQIAAQFERIGLKYDFSTDISVREQDRLYGRKWLEFLKTCRISVGTESGASVVDFDSVIRARCQQYCAEHPNAKYEDVRPFFADVDGKVVIQTISSRIFEAAAFQHTLVLHEGSYAGILQPDVHFISVKKDYSNEAEVVAKMRDIAFCKKLAIQSHADLIQSGRYDYHSFTKWFDGIIEDHVPIPIRTTTPNRVLFYADNYLHGDCILPRSGNYVILPGVAEIAKQCVEEIPYRNMLMFTCSFSLILKLLANCDVLRRRVVEAVTKSGSRSFTWRGLLRDLRILALLNSSRARGCPFGPPYEVRLDVDEDENRFVFRSMPKENENDASQHQQQEHELLKQLSDEHVSGPLSWDHGAVGTNLVMPISGKHYDLIHINEKGVYDLTHLHQLFAENPQDENALLDDVLHCDLTKTRLAKTLATTAQLAASVGVLLFVRKPAAIVAKLTNRVRKAA